jgi:hypothetical protein
LRLSTAVTSPVLTPFSSLPSFLHRRLQQSTASSGPCPFSLLSSLVSLRIQRFKVPSSNASRFSRPPSTSIFVSFPTFPGCYSFLVPSIPSAVSLESTINGRGSFAFYVPLDAHRFADSRKNEFAACLLLLCLVSPPPSSSLPRRRRRASSPSIPSSRRPRDSARPAQTKREVRFQRPLVLSLDGRLLYTTTLPRSSAKPSASSHRLPLPRTETPTSHQLSTTTAATTAVRTPE